MQTNTNTNTNTDTNTNTNTITNTNTYTYTNAYTYKNACHRGSNRGSKLRAPRASMLPTRYLYWLLFWGLVVPENVHAQFPSILPIRSGSRRRSQNR